MTVEGRRAAAELSAKAPAQRLIWGPRTRPGLLAAALAFLLDQGSKVWLLHIYDLGARGVVEVLPFFDLVLTWNAGISYGLFPQESDLGRWLLIAFMLLAALALWVWLARVESAFGAVAIGLTIGGALGNALDRVLYGAVADFFSLHALGFHWYIFNIADVAIVAGVLGLLYESAKSSHTPAAE